ncbi:MAG TPA: hypothetical protein DIW17_09455 [Clostridiales bacterium]|nr:hypothetical protein [Clostridiales bacterium]
MLLLFKNDFKRMISRRELWFVLLSSIIFAGLSCLEKISIYGDQNKSLMISATQAFMLWYPNLGVAYLYFILPLFASLVYSDQYYREYESGIINVQITRQNRNQYYISKLLMSVISGFFITIFPLLFNFLLCIIAFPLKATAATETGSIYMTSLSKEIQWVQFPNLYMNYPLLYTLMHILLAGILGSALSLLSFALTLHIQKNIIVASCTSTLIYLVYSVGINALKLSEYTPFLFLLTAPEGYTKNTLIYLSIILVLVISSSFLIVNKLMYNKDVLI